MKNFSLLSQLKSVGYSGRANNFSRRGQPQSGQKMLSPFSQTLYCTVLDEKSNNLLPFFFRRTTLNYYSATVTEMGICYTAVQQKFEVLALNFIVLSLMSTH